MRAYAPNGQIIVGTLERLTALQNVDPASFTRRPDERLGFDRLATPPAVTWESQETVWRDGQPYYVAADGTTWPENKLTLKE